MPHEFKIKCYKDAAWNGRAKVGDVVYLKARPDIPMSVCVVPHVNTSANKVGPVKVRWMKPDGTIETGEFFANELSL